MEQQMEFNFESSIRGYHVYKSIWTYEIGEKLRCDREENNPNDKFAVKLIRNDGNKEQCVGHVPIEQSKVFNFFLKRGGKIFATVTGNKFFNIGLELPCTYTFSGQAADVEKLRTLLKPTAT
jgi:hypothetical protein